MGRLVDVGMAEDDEERVEGADVAVGDELLVEL